MAKQRITKGAIVEINVADKFYTYGQILGKASIAFFDYKSEKKLMELSELEKVPVLFILSVYDNAITEGRWEKVGKIDIRNALEVLPMQFIQDSINPKSFELYNPNTGDMTPAKKEDCINLECAAVWEAEHVEDRINDHYAGKENVWLQQLKIK